MLGAVQKISSGYPSLRQGEVQASQSATRSSSAAEAGAMPPEGVKPGQCRRKFAACSIPSFIIIIIFPKDVLPHLSIVSIQQRVSKVGFDKLRQVLLVQWRVGVTYQFDCSLIT
jgi:hypothetical protein